VLARAPLLCHDRPAISPPPTATARAEERTMKPTGKPGDIKPPAETATPLSDLKAQLDQVAEQERVVALQKRKVLGSYYEVQIGQMRAVIRELVDAGYKPAQIAKALGLGAQPRAASASPSSAAVRPGPTTHAAWLQLFLGRAVQTYLKEHPDLAASLKAQGIKPAQFRDHIPRTDMAALEAQARQKADAKGAASGPVPMPRDTEVQHDQSPSRNATQKLG